MIMFLVTVHVFELRTESNFIHNSWSISFKWYRGDGDEREYLVKWKELPYDESTWELESDISTFQAEIERFNLFQSRSRKFSYGKQKRSVNNDAGLTKQQKEFQQYERSPEFLSGGMCFD
jgi:chromodomain-helicase-DNA-binding protein 4